MKFAWEGGTVTGTWDVPEGATRGALVLAHSAGSDYRAKLLQAVAAGMASRGIATLRFNFPYKEAGKKLPDPQPKLQACFRAVADTVANQITPVFLGGKSLGGRIASHVAASGFHAAGLIFLGYPLHPPGKPEKIRDAHLPDVRCPILWLQGTRDPFSTEPYLADTIAKLPLATLSPVDGGDHSFKVSGRDPADVTEDLIERAGDFVDRVLSGA